MFWKSLLLPSSRDGFATDNILVVQQHVLASPVINDDDDDVRVCSASQKQAI
jgi:hypothetical protein